MKRPLFAALLVCSALAGCDDPAAPRPTAAVAEDPVLSSHADGWVALAPMPTARITPATAVVGGKLYVMGGNTGSGHGDGVALSTVEVYDPATNSWATRRPMPGPRFHGNGAAVIDGKIYVAGGRDRSCVPGCVVGTLFVYDPATDTWSQRAHMPMPASSGASAAIGGKLYVFNGHYGGYRTDLYRYDPAADRWEVLPPAPHWHAFGAAGAIDGKFYIAGGEPMLPHLDVFDPSTAAWTMRAPLPSGWQHMASVVVDGILYSVGGTSLTGVPPWYTTVAVMGYDPRTDQWRCGPPLPQPTHLLAGGEVDGTIYVVGGYASLSDGSRRVVADLFAWTPTRPLRSCGTSNTPPIANAGADYVGSEGSTVPLSLGGADPDGDILSFTWDLGDGTTGAGAAPPTGHTFADDGVYRIVITVDDGNGASDADTAQAVVSNVAPAVDAGPQATIYSGESFSLGASFRDPGLLDGPWSYHIDWGNGSSDGTTELQGGISATRRYLEPGTLPVTVAVTDKDGGTGSAATRVTVERLPVRIDVKPGSPTNPVSLRGQGVIPVAVLSDDEFAATRIEASTARFGPGGATEVHGRGHPEDLDGDGDLDLVLHFDAEASGFSCGDSAGVLTARTVDGVYIIGTDVVRPLCR